jgi:hypothetical protein
MGHTCRRSTYRTHFTGAGVLVRGGCLWRGAPACIPYIFRILTAYIPHMYRMYTVYIYIIYIYIIHTVYIRYRFNLHTVYLRSATSLQMKAPDKFVFNTHTQTHTHTHTHTEYIHGIYTQRDELANGGPGQVSLQEVQRHHQRARFFCFCFL